MLDLLKSRRSIRKFKDEEIEKEKIEKILKAGLLAPSSRARRPWEFIAVTDKGLLSKLSFSRAQGSSSFLGKAPLGIVIIADKELCDVWIEDASIATTIIQLTAQSIGLGSCWIQVRERYYDNVTSSEDYIKEVLNIPSKYAVLCMLAVGYAHEEKLSYDEDKLLYNKIHINEF
jgi:nitroreductase